MARVIVRRDRSVSVVNQRGPIRVVTGGRGARGKQGHGLKLDAIGTFAARATHDEAAEGFMYGSTDGDGALITTSVAFRKNSVASADWSDAIGIQGVHGIDGASQLIRVRVVAITNVAIANGLEDGDTLDGVALFENDLVLLTGQTAPEENGIYVVLASGSASRHASFDTFDDLPGVYFSVMEGTANADTLWRCTSDIGGTIGSTAIAIENVALSHKTIAPRASDGGSLGTALFPFSDLFLAVGGVINNGGITITESTNALAFAGASNGYTFDSAVRPSANDGAALGSGSAGWSDLFLASGGVINFANNTANLTQSARTITLNGNGSDTVLQINNAQSDGRADLRLRSGGSSPDQFITFGDAASFDNGYIQYAHSIDAFLFSIGGSEQLRIDGGAYYFPPIGTTGSAANAFLNSGSSPANQLLRSTSSLRYKSGIEDVEEGRALDFLEKARPIFYRSLAPADKRSDGAPYTFYSFGAEDVAAIDPRLAQWGYRDEDWETIETSREPLRHERKLLRKEAQPNKKGQYGAEDYETSVELEQLPPAKHRRLKDGAELVPDGINTNAVLAMLTRAVQLLQRRVDAQEKQDAS